MRGGRNVQKNVEEKWKKWNAPEKHKNDTRIKFFATNLKVIMKEKNLSLFLFVFSGVAPNQLPLHN